MQLSSEGFGAKVVMQVAAAELGDCLDSDISLTNEEMEKASQLLLMKACLMEDLPTARVCATSLRPSDTRERSA